MVTRLQSYKVTGLHGYVVKPQEVNWSNNCMNYTSNWDRFEVRTALDAM